MQAAKASALIQVARRTNERSHPIVDFWIGRTARVFECQRNWRAYPGRHHADRKVFMNRKMYFGAVKIEHGIVFPFFDRKTVGCELITRGKNTCSAHLTFSDILIVVDWAHRFDIALGNIDFT